MIYGDWGIRTSGETLAVQNRAKKSAVSMAPSIIVLLGEFVRVFELVLVLEFEFFGVVGSC